MYEVWQLCDVDGQTWRQVMCRCDYDWQAATIGQTLSPMYNDGVITWGKASERKHDLPWLTVR